MISISTSYIAFDNQSLDSVDNKKSKRIINEANGQMNVDDCLLTKEEICIYTVGKDFSSSNAEKYGFKEGDIVRVYRPLEEIKKSLPYHRMLPLLYDHKMIDSYTLEQILSQEEELYSLFDQQDEELRNKRLAELKIEIIGTMGSNPYIYLDALFNDLAAWTEKGKKAIIGGKRKLSIGYLTDYVREDGVFNGEAYDFRQTNIRCNHVTICYTGRCDDAIVADSVSNFSTVTKEEVTVSHMTAEQKKAFASSIAQDNGGNTMPEIIKTIGEVTKAEDEKSKDCNTMDTDKDKAEDNEPKDEKKAEDNVEQPEKSAEKKEKAEDTDEPKKDKAEDNEDKPKDKAEDSITMSKSELARLIKSESRKVYEQAAMDSLYATDIKKKVADMTGFAMDSLPQNAEVAMDAALSALKLNNFLNKKTFNEKKVALDVAYHLLSQSPVRMDDKAMSEIAEDSIDDSDDYVKGA